jgi:16S rRNA (guanine527-N7)-methyltransferase
MPHESGADALATRLANACSKLDIPAEAETRERLLAYLRLIQHWNRVYNLTALRDPAEMLTHHLLDCLAIVPPLRRRLDSTPQPPRLLDVGSGAGLPGAVLAILRPDWQVTCIDAVAKKATFIRQVAAELTLPNLEGIHGRVEDDRLWGARRFDLVLSRAFASLADFVALTRTTMAPDGVWAAMKATPSAAELAAIPADVEVFHVEHLQVPELDAERRLVWLRPHRVGSPTKADHRQSPD